MVLKKMKVKIEYETIEPVILTISDAIKHNSKFDQTRVPELHQLITLMKLNVSYPHSGSQELKKISHQF